MAYGRSEYWKSVDHAKRVRLSRRWFQPFAHLEGVCRVAKSTGKPHYYVKMADGTEASVTWKKQGDFIIHHPAPTGAAGMRMPRAHAVKWLERRGAVHRKPVDQAT